MHEALSTIDSCLKRPMPAYTENPSVYMLFGLSTNRHGLALFYLRALHDTLVDVCQAVHPTYPVLCQWTFTGARVVRRHHYISERTSKHKCINTCRNPMEIQSSTWEKSPEGHVMLGKWDYKYLCIYGFTVWARIRIHFNDYENNFSARYCHI